jgi:HrpA-like RNA helicase
VRSNLTSVILQLLALEIRDVAGFDYVTPPTGPAIASALELLFNLGERGGVGRCWLTCSSSVMAAGEFGWRFLLFFLAIAHTLSHSLT